MNRRAHSPLTLIVLFTALLWPPGLANAQTPEPSPTQAATPQSTCNGDSSSDAGEKVKLYYMRQATNINTILTAVATASPTPSVLNGLVIKNASEDEIILYGPCKKRRQASRIIATLDLPRPGIMMEMWGVQVTSKKPDKMAQVMALIRQEINNTQQAVRETYSRLELLTRKQIPVTSLEHQQFVRILEDNLGYRSALSDDHPLSLADILLRMTAADDPGGATARIANDLQLWLKDNHPTYLAELNKQAGKVKNQKIAVRTRAPFERFFGERGLVRKKDSWEEDKDVDLRRKARIGQIAVLDFALEYGRLIHQPQSFDPYYLQHSSEALNTRLQLATDALNLDMQDLFVEPTLERIREVVRKFKDVEYAQVGKTTVASLSGITAVVASKSVGAFDVTPPLTLGELLTKAKTLSDNVNPFIPKPADNLVGAMPLSQVIGLIGAFGEDRTVWRELSAGISLNITPNVLRNMTSAELKVDLKTGDPNITASSDKVKPLSRVTQHDVNTSVYVNPLDFFDLSAFASQSTLDGGRGYVPIIGPVWRGLFGEIPIAGKIFSWKRGTQNVYSQSLVLTTSFITPTSRGIAVLYPTELLNKDGAKRPYTDQVYQEQSTAVAKFKSLR